MTDDTTAEPEVVEETPTEEQIEDTATSEDVEAKEQETEEEKPKPRRNRRSHSRRIDQLTAQVREKERELERIKAAQTQVPTDPGTAPKREDFEDYEAYIEAKAEHRAVQAAEKRLSEAEKARQDADAQAQEEQQHRAFEEAREATLDRGSELYDDFEDVVSDEGLHISPVMADALLSSQKGHELWYHLGKNPEVAEKIAGLHPVQQLMELGRLEANLAGGKTASGAPKPTRPVQPRGATNNALNDKLDIREWMKRRTEEVRKSSL